MADKKPDSKSPLSIPLDKGEGVPPRQTPPRTGAEPSYGYKTFERPPQPETGGGLRFWMVMVAMFLFPFFFHAGTDLYKLARAALSSKVDSMKEQTDKPEADSGRQAELKELEKLTAILEHQTKILGEGAGKVVIIHPSYPSAFSFDSEKAKIYELVGINLDDPPAVANKIEKVKSVELLYSLMESLDRVVLNAAQNNVSDFHVKNAIEWKKRALKRLQELR